MFSQHPQDSRSRTSDRQARRRGKDTKAAGYVEIDKAVVDVADASNVSGTSGTVGTVPEAGEAPAIEHISSDETDLD